MRALFAVFAGAVVALAGTPGHAASAQAVSEHTVSTQTPSTQTPSTRAAFGHTAAAHPVSAASAAPARGAGNTFALAANKTSAYGTYDRMMGIPGRPVPPVAVNGTLAVDQLLRCGVVQIAYNGPADGIAWRTVGSRCRPGKSAFRAQSEFLRGGAKPALRLCSGLTVRFAERSRACDVFTPPADL